MFKFEEGMEVQFHYANNLRYGIVREVSGNGKTVLLVDTDGEPGKFRRFFIEAMRNCVVKSLGAEANK